MKRLIASCAAAALIGGCAGSPPTQIRLSILSVSSTRICVVPTSTTNAAGRADSPRDADAMTVSPSQSGGVVLVVDSQIALPNGGGTASSNNVPLSISANKQ